MIQIAARRDTECLRYLQAKHQHPGRSHSARLYLLKREWTVSPATVLPVLLELVRIPSAARQRKACIKRAQALAA